MGKSVYNRIEDWSGENILRRSGVGGGCISLAERIVFKSGRTVFLKSGSKEGLFKCEANGLKELAKAGVVHVPEVLLSDSDFILLENIESGLRKKDFFQIFGRQFARLHLYSGSGYGFYENNFIGLTPQINIPAAEETLDWTEFYFNKRLLFQFQLAEKNGYANDKLRKGFHLLESKIRYILSGSEESPCLLHGDLWSGNYLAGPQGEPVLIDPAVYYGHREADLAMTKLFGGFTPEFYHSYNEEHPLKDGADYRENIYKLYHALNHLNLFGSGYYSQTENLLWSYF